MTTYSVPYTFVPGTKAKATEVNANFSKVIDLIEETNQNSLKTDLSNISNAGKSVIYNNSAPAKLLGEIITSAIPLSDSGLHLLDGSTISAGGVYDAFVDYIADLYTSGDYTAIFDTEANWQDAVTANGVCGKFVYTAASGNNPATVRLPKYSNKIYTSNINSTSPVKGSGKTLGISDGTDLYGMDGVITTYGLRAVKQAADKDIGTTGAAAGGTYPPQYSILGITTDGTKSGLIADLSDITTSLDGYYYIVVATTTKTEIEVDIDEITTDLNGKADTDLSNVSNTSGFRKLAEVYNNGTSWYKVYNEYNPSTGTYIGQWCEQGGLYYKGSTVAGTNQITFLKEFANTNYSFIPALIHSATSAAIYTPLEQYTERTTSAAKITIYSAAFGYAWIACGYIS